MESAREYTSRIPNRLAAPSRRRFFGPQTHPWMGYNLNVTTTYEYRRFVEQAPDVRSGSPCVAGTGVRVIHLLRLYRERGLTAREIAVELGLRVADVHGALAFALDNEVALDREEREREQWVERFRAGRASISA